MISTLSSTIALRTASATASGVVVPISGGVLAPASANIPASRTKPGETSETPIPRGARSVRRPSAKPRRPNLVAL